MITVIVLAVLVLFCILYVWFVKPEIILNLAERWQMYSVGLKKKSTMAGNYKWTYVQRGRPHYKYPSMLFVHGFSMSKEAWTGVIKYLPKDQHIIVVDLPGHGDTDEMTLPQDIYPCLIDKLHEFVRLVGLDTKPFHLIGLSMGGAITINYALMYPECTAAASILCPAMNTPEKSTMIKEMLQGKTSCLIDFTEAGIERMMSMAVYGGMRAPRNIIRGILNKRLKYKEFFIKLFNLILLEENLRTTTNAELSVPTQIIWGENDQILHFSGAETLKKNFKSNKETHILQDCGHTIILERPLKLAAILIEFRQNHVYAKDEQHNKQI